jgi:sialate O-acetylesterase
MRVRAYTHLLMACLAAWPAPASVRLAKVFSDGAVLQQGRPVPVWGWAAPGESVTVTFAGQSKPVVADAQGRWSVRLDPLAVSKAGRYLTAAGTNTVRARDVLVGEVWLCGGQSNMEMTVHHTVNAAAEEAAANYPTIRCLKVLRDHAGQPLDDARAADLPWVTCTPSSVGSFTAVGYYFARELTQNLDVPVGLLSSNLGGTLIESWTNPAGWRLVPELTDFAAQADRWDPTTAAGNAAYAAYLTEVEAWLPRARAAVAARAAVPAMPVAPGPFDDVMSAQTLYNAMIAPFVPYALRGALWYQGEANGGERDSYLHKMRALVGGWRQAWGQGNFPFYYVQLANFEQREATSFAPVREAQRLALARIPQTGMAVTIDIGETRDVHPPDKQDVGHRLALWALARDYGRSVTPSGPLLRAATYEQGRVRVTFDHAESGLMAGAHDRTKPYEPTKELPGTKLTWFHLAGADGRWFPADAVIDGASLLVSTPSVPIPQSIRYAYASSPDGANLYNRAGLPASPFDVPVAGAPTVGARARSVNWTYGAGALGREALERFGGGALLALRQLVAAKVGRVFDYSLEGAGEQAVLTVGRHTAAGRPAPLDPPGAPQPGAAFQTTDGTLTGGPLASGEFRYAPLAAKQDRAAAAAALVVLADAASSGAALLPGAGPLAAALLDYLGEQPLNAGRRGDGNELALAGQTPAGADLVVDGVPGLALGLDPAPGLGAVALRAWSSALDPPGATSRGLELAAGGTVTLSASAPWWDNTWAGRSVALAHRLERRERDGVAEVAVALTADGDPGLPLTSPHGVRHSEVVFGAPALAHLGRQAPDSVVARLAAMDQRPCRVPADPRQLDTELAAAARVAAEAGALDLRTLQRHEQLATLTNLGSAAAALQVGFRAEAGIGQSYLLRTGRLSADLRTTDEQWFAPLASAYEGAIGVATFHRQLLDRAVQVVGTRLSRAYRPAEATVAAPGRTTLALAEGGATLVVENGRWLEVEPAGVRAAAWSWRPDLPFLAPGQGRAADTVVFRPYRARQAAPTGRAAQRDLELTVVGSVHRLGVKATGDGTWAASFPTRCMTLEVAVTPAMLDQAGLSSADRERVTLWRLDDRTGLWQAIDGLRAEVTLPGVYAAGLLGRPAATQRPQLRVLTPPGGSVVGPRPVLSARVALTPAVDPATARISIDGLEVGGLASTADAAGLTLSAAPAVALTPGRHQARFSVATLEGQTTAAEVAFEVTASGGGVPGAGLALVSVPFTPRADRLSATLAADQAQFAFHTPDGWRFQPRDVPARQLRPGEGAWAWLPLAPRANLLGAPTDSGQPFDLPLRAGWNLIGNPWPVAASWDLLRIRVLAGGRELRLAQAGDLVDPYAWGFQPDAADPRTGRYTLVYDPTLVPGASATLEPWRGYWLRARQDVTLRLPPPAGTPTRRVVDGTAGWSWVLRARCGAGEAEVTCGLTRGAALVAGTPPAAPFGGPGPWLALLAGEERLAASVQPWLTARVTWTIEVRPPAAGDVTLTWPSLRALPPDVGLTLSDPTNGRQVWLRQRTAYTYRPAPGESARRVHLVAERCDPAAGPRVTALRAEAGRGGGLDVLYALSASAETTVALHGLNGRLVQAMAPGMQAAGPQRLAWPARDDAGRPLPPGLYRLTVAATDALGRQTRASAVVRLP